MAWSLEEQARMYERSWSASLASGKEQQGNLEVNLKFLEQVDVIRPEMDLLEVGCGIGTVVYELSKKGCRAIGTDISSKAIEYGRDKYPQVVLEVQPAERLSYADESFDVVVSFDLLEHLVEVDAHLKEVRRVLRGGGYYLSGTPNKYASAMFDTIRKRNFSWKISHPSLHSWRELRGRFAKHGFSCRFVKMNPVSEFTLGKLRGYGPLAWLVQRVNIARLPLSLQSALYAAARKI
ncbi:MAG: hypothetical protein AMJ79_15035 [Phycisphaerae bacterium SM23_30]|nr:MAG: hypothetical protein AMJ79_15035 [Phycisphaerae bacterium SM23_30]